MMLSATAKSGIITSLQAALNQRLNNHRRLHTNAGPAVMAARQGVYECWNRGLPLDITRLGIPLASRAFRCDKHSWWRLSRDMQPFCRLSNCQLFLLWGAGLLEMVCTGTGLAYQELWINLGKTENVDELIALANVLQAMQNRHSGREQLLEEIRTLADSTLVVELPAGAVGNVTEIAWTEEGIVQLTITVAAPLPEIITLRVAP